MNITMKMFILSVMASIMILAMIRIVLVMMFKDADIVTAFVMGGIAVTSLAAAILMRLFRP